ncbi:MAG: hypothetical protein AAGA48_22420 [Myxococcota bacterium]
MTASSRFVPDIVNVDDVLARVLASAADHFTKACQQFSHTPRDSCFDRARWLVLVVAVTQWEGALAQRHPVADRISALVDPIASSQRLRVPASMTHWAPPSSTAQNASIAVVDTPMTV